jgi:hypothetical protein
MEYIYVHRYGFILVKNNNDFCTLRVYLMMVLGDRSM